jgi:hypothetical protein
MTKSTTTASRAKRPVNPNIARRSLHAPARINKISEIDRSGPDAEIFLAGRRHNELSAAMDCLPDGNPHWSVLCRARVDITHRALLFQVETDAGLAEKRRIVEVEDIEVSSNHWNGDFHEFIYGLDEERIAAAAEVTDRDHGELTPISCKYVSADKILVSLATKTGDVFSFPLSTDSMVHLTNLMVAVVQNFTAQVLRDLRTT